MSVKVAKEVYKGYMPIDLPQHRPKQIFKPWFKVLGKPRVTIYPKKEENVGFSEKPEYPPLNDGSLKGLRIQYRTDWYDSIKALPTTEEKAIEIGKHCNHYIAHFNNWMKVYNSLPMVQYLTQTKLIESLPEKYATTTSTNTSTSTTPTTTTTTTTTTTPCENPTKHDQKLIASMRECILDQIALDKYNSLKQSPWYVSKVVRDGNRQYHVSSSLVQNLVNVAKKNIALELNSDLLNYKYDLSPAIRSWWYHSGFQPPNDKPYFKSRKDEDGNVNTMIQLDGAAALTIRDDKFLEPQLPLTDPLVKDTSLVEKYSYPLKTFGAVYKFKNPVSLPGFWFDHQSRVDCPHTCFLTTDCLQMRDQGIHLNPIQPADHENCLNAQAIMTAYGWMNGLSLAQGYTPFQELDYPFTCQVITTDGQNWLFNLYQLNSHSFHRDLGGPIRNNICWSSGLKQLYTDYKDGTFHNVNDEVIQLLVQFLAQKTSESYTSQLNLRPYLGTDTQSDEQRDLTRAALKKIYANGNDKWLSHQWKVPIFEHLFFRSKENRHRITHMKPQWHVPIPKTPKIFE